MQVRSFLKTVAIGVGLGVLFSSFYASGDPARAPRILAGGAVTGAMISVFIFSLERLFGARMERLPPRGGMVAQALITLAGSLTGWIAGMLVSSYLFGFGISFATLTHLNFLLTMVVTGTVAVVVGLSFYAYELLQRRLERTIAQLKEREWAEKELQLARDIQKRLLPPTRIDGDGYTISARNLPAHLVAGDFYDVVRLDDGSVVIVVADVAGKGVGASLIMASVKAVLPFVAREGARQAMSTLNEKLMRELGRREFVALAYAHYHPSTGAFSLLNAGFPEPYIVSGDGVRAIAGDGVRLPLGVRNDVAYEPVQASIARGERLVFLSDGIPEAPVEGEPLGYDRVAELLRACAESERDGEWVDGLLGRVRAIVGDDLEDDWTAVVLERR